MELIEGTTGGQHRSVYVAERIHAWLVSRGENVTITHREFLGAI